MHPCAFLYALSHPAPTTRLRRPDPSACPHTLPAFSPTRTFAVGCGGVAAGLFGMNLPSGLEHSQYAFVGMATSVFLLSSSVFLYFLRRMRSLVRSRKLLP